MQHAQAVATLKQVSAAHISTAVVCMLAEDCEEDLRLRYAWQTQQAMLKTNQEKTSTATPNHIHQAADTHTLSISRTQTHTHLDIHSQQPAVACRNKYQYTHNSLFPTAFRDCACADRHAALYVMALHVMARYIQECDFQLSCWIMGKT